MQKQKATPKSDRMNSKIPILLLVAGLGCLGFGLLIAPTIDKYNIDSVSMAPIRDDSGTNITLCTVKSFHLELNQKLTASFFVSMNATVNGSMDVFHIKFISAENYTANATSDPSSALLGLSYNWAQLSYPPQAAPSYGASADMAISQGLNYLIEFVGNASTIYKPIPGDFKMILWVEDSSIDYTTLYYNMTIQLDHLGPTLMMWFSIIGAALVAVGGIIMVRAKR